MFKRQVLIFLAVISIAGSIGYLIGGVQPFSRPPVRLLQRVRPTLFEVRTTEVEFFSANLRLHGTLYTPASSLYTYPGIVICHGGTPLGRRLALYVVMARALAEQGYVALTFDFRGFGESEDPHRFETFSDLDFVQDVTSALTLLEGIPQIDRSKLYVIGHSFGAGVGVAAGIRDIRIGKVVSISPGRGTEAKYFGENASEPEFPQIRMSNDMKISPYIPRKLFYPHLRDYVAEAILKYPIHPPLLLIDGARESQEELAFLKDVYKRMTTPKAYVTIGAADHYFGTKRDQDGSYRDIPYNEAILNELIAVIDRWLSQKD